MKTTKRFGFAVAMMGAALMTGSGPSLQAGDNGFEGDFAVYKCTARGTFEVNVDGEDCFRERSISMSIIVRDLRDGRDQYSEIFLDSEGGVDGVDSELSFQKVLCVTCPGDRPRQKEAIIEAFCSDGEQPMIVTPQGLGGPGELFSFQSKVSGNTRKLTLRYEEPKTLERIEVVLPKVALFLRGSRNALQCSSGFLEQGSLEPLGGGPTSPGWLCQSDRVSYRLNRDLTALVNDPEDGALDLEEATGIVLATLEPDVR